MTERTGSSESYVADLTAEQQQRIEAIGDQLRSKIISKFQTSTVLAGFAFTLLTIQISLLWQASTVPQTFPFSVGLMSTAVILFVAAIVKLDELTMPKRFWDEDKKKKDPIASRLSYLNDDDLWELHKRMRFYWKTLIFVATAIAAVSLISMLWPWATSVKPTELAKETFAYVWSAVFLTATYFILLHFLAKRRFSPLMRTSD